MPRRIRGVINSEASCKSSHRRAGPSRGWALEVVGSDHHGGGAQRVAGAPEVVPLDAVELPDVVSDGVVDAVEVGEATGVKPPTWRRSRERRRKHQRFGSPSPVSSLFAPSL